LAAKWAGISNIFVACDRHEAAMAGFDYRWSYHFINQGGPCAPMQVKKLSIAGANGPFKRWEELRANTLADNKIAFLAANIVEA